jgi:hypothetical protein
MRQTRMLGDVYRDCQEAFAIVFLLQLELGQGRLRVSLCNCFHVAGREVVRVTEEGHG